MLGGLKAGQALRRSPVGTHLPKGIAKIGSVDNYVFLAPCAASAARSIGQNGHRSAACRDLPEFPVSEVPDELSVRRPEGKGGILRAVQLRRRASIEGLNIQ